MDEERGFIGDMREDSQKNLEGSRLNRTIGGRGGGKGGRERRKAREGTRSQI